MFGKTRAPLANPSRAPREPEQAERFPNVPTTVEGPEKGLCCNALAREMGLFRPLCRIAAGAREGGDATQTWAARSRGRDGTA